MMAGDDVALSIWKPRSSHPGPALLCWLQVRLPITFGRGSTASWSLHDTSACPTIHQTPKFATADTSSFHKTIFYLQIFRISSQKSSLLCASQEVISLHDYGTHRDAHSPAQAERWQINTHGTSALLGLLVTRNRLGYADFATACLWNGYSLVIQGVFSHSERPLNVSYRYKTGDESQVDRSLIDATKLAIRLEYYHLDGAEGESHSAC